MAHRPYNTGVSLLCDLYRVLVGRNLACSCLPGWHKYVSRLEFWTNVLINQTSPLLRWEPLRFARSLRSSGEVETILSLDLSHNYDQHDPHKPHCISPALGPPDLLQAVPFIRHASLHWDNRSSHRISSPSQRFRYYCGGHSAKFRERRFPTSELLGL